MPINKTEKKLIELESRIKDIEDGNIRHLKQIAEIIQEEMREEILEAVEVFLKQYVREKKVKDRGKRKN